MHHIVSIALLFIVSVSQVFSQTTKLKLEDVVSSPIFRPATVDEIRSTSDGTHYTILQGYSDIIRYKYSNGLATDTVFSLNSFYSQKIPYISRYEFNTNETGLLLTTNETPIYRHSFTADYYYYDIQKKKLTPVSVNGKQKIATFSPSGDKIAFVRENNIYLVDVASGKETQITFDGKKNEIINGAPDWVYEEEFGFSKGFDWSPDGKKIAFMRFDESRVKTFTIPFYDNLYPTLYTYKYPKAGEENSIVSICVYDLATKTTRTADVGNEKDQYIPRIKWTLNPEILCLLRLNRLQNKIDVLMANASTGKTETVFTETNKCFISEVNDKYITFLKDGKHFLIFSERDGFNHLYLYTMDGKLVNQVTRGDYDIDDLCAVNDAGTIYYISSEASPLDRNLYSIQPDGKKKKQLSKLKGTNSAEFSSTCKYYINTLSDANTPPVVTLHEADGKAVRTLVDNKQLSEKIKYYGFSKKEFFTAPTEEGILLNGYMIKPADFDSTKKYPVFMTVYGGPESQDVTNSWDTQMGWYQLLAQKGYIVVCVDNRGTDGRGEAFKKSTYMQLGKLETRDQINVAKYLGTISYVDKNRIGIFGWSYGGYMSSLCMTIGADFFKMGIAVAPVTNWRFYDSVYTERFLRTPQENPSGYDDNSPINHASQLKGKFLIVHGSADDNVHLQNTMVFTEKLIQAGKTFDMAIYPDKNHSIYGGKTRWNLYKRMTDFILENL